MGSDAGRHALSTAIEDGVAVITLDLVDESINKLSRAVRDEFMAAVSAAQEDPSVRAIVLISGKPENFIAGADIEEFVAVDVYIPQLAGSNLRRAGVHAQTAFSAPAFIDGRT